jgi:hypothetical protein
MVNRRVMSPLENKTSFVNKKKTCGLWTAPMHGKGDGTTFFKN